MVNRARWFLACVAGVIALLAAACSDEAATAMPTLPVAVSGSSSPRVLEAFREVQGPVERLRGLAPLADVEPELMMRADLLDFLVERVDAEDRAELALDQDLLSTLGLIPEDLDLYELVLDLLEEQVLGLYDHEDEELYLVSDSTSSGPMDEMTLAHEYVHALQQQHFDLNALTEAVEGDSEASNALQALIEGDAYLSGGLYMLGEFSPSERAELAQADDSSPVFDAAPYVVQQSLLFEGIEGINFVLELYSSGQFEAVDRAYADPPMTTEQILHPEKYLIGELPEPVAMPDIAEGLGGGWTELHSDVLGEFFLRTYLETAVADEEAALAAAGWNGDRFVLIGGPDDVRVFAWLTSWDSAQDAREFRDTFRHVDHFGHRVLEVQGNRVLIVFAPDGDAAARVRTQFGDF